MVAFWVLLLQQCGLSNLPQTPKEETSLPRFRERQRPVIHMLILPKLKRISEFLETTKMDLGFKPKLHK